jgi:hypothetical protein
MTVRRKIARCLVILDIWERCRTCIPGVPIGAREDSPDSGEPFSGLVPRPRHRKHRRHDNAGWSTIVSQKHVLTSCKFAKLRASNARIGRKISATGAMKTALAQGLKGPPPKRCPLAPGLTLSGEVPEPWILWCCIL